MSASVRSRISLSGAFPPPRTRTGIPSGDLDNLVIHAHVVGRIGFDDVRSQLNRLSNERKNLHRIAIHHVAAGGRVGLKDERFDHQRHAVSITLRFDLQDILNALIARFRLIRDAKEVYHDASGIQTKRLFDRVFNHAAEEGARELLAVDIGHVGPQHQRRLLAPRQRLQESSLTEGQLNGIGRGRNQGFDGIGKIFDPGKKAILIEKPMIDSDVEAAVGFGVKKTVQTIRFHEKLCRVGASAGA